MGYTKLNSEQEQAEQQKASLSFFSPLQEGHVGATWPFSIPSRFSIVTF